MLNFFSNLSTFPFLHEGMYKYNKTKDSLHDPTKLAIHFILRPEVDLISNCCHIFKKMVSLDDMVHFIDEENIVTYVDFDCGNTSFLKILQKRDRSTEGNNISRSTENLKCIPKNEYHNPFVEEQTSNIIFNLYSL